MNPQIQEKELTEEIALRVRDVLRQTAMEHEVTIVSGKVASDHIHVLAAYRPHAGVNMIVQWLKTISSRILLQGFPHLKRQFWGRHCCASGYRAVSTGGSTDERVQQYIAEQEGEPVHEATPFRAVVVH